MKSLQLLSVLFISLFFLTSSTSLYSNSVFGNSNNKNQEVFLDYTERVLIDGEWWIIVYDEDSGVIKAFYKEPNY
jgi:hypothetical protein